MKNKFYSNRGVPRNKKPLKNIVYKVEVSQLKSTAPVEEYEEYKFKELGYLVLYWWYEEKEPITNFHGFITVEQLKDLIGSKQYAKFCQGKREFIIQRRINNKNLKK